MIMLGQLAFFLRASKPVITNNTNWHSGEPVIPVFSLSFRVLRGILEAPAIPKIPRKTRNDNSSCSDNSCQNANSFLSQ
jgi:hypothetical protein